MTPTEILRRTKALIHDPEHWCNDAPPGRRGDARCLATAFAAIHRDDLASPFAEEQVHAFRDAAEAITHAIGTWRWGTWNDSHTHAEVMDALDRAIFYQREENRG
jgi:hypothetical protein